MTDEGFTCASAIYDYPDLVQVSVNSLDTSTCAAKTAGRTVTNTYDVRGRLTAAEVTIGPDVGDKPVIAKYDAVGNA